MEEYCLRCHRPIRVIAEHSRTFEGMHYVCFHYEFEHGDADPDEECSAGGCPSSSILAGGRAKAIAVARELSDELASGAPWRNDNLWTYLEAFATWLTSADGYYLENGRRPPGDGWFIVADALRAATSNE